MHYIQGRRCVIHTSAWGIISWDLVARSYNGVLVGSHHDCFGTHPRNWHDDTWLVPTSMVKNLHRNACCIAGGNCLVDFRIKPSWCLHTVLTSVEEAILKVQKVFDHSVQTQRIQLSNKFLYTLWMASSCRIPYCHSLFSVRLWTILSSSAIWKNSWLAPSAGIKARPLFKGDCGGGGKRADAAAAMTTTYFIACTL